MMAFIGRQGGDVPSQVPPQAASESPALGPPARAGPEAPQDLVNDPAFVQHLAAVQSSVDMDAVIADSLSGMYGGRERLGPGPAGASPGEGAGRNTGKGGVAPTGTGASASIPSSIPSSLSASTLSYCSDETVLLQKRKQMYDYQRRLEEKREEFGQELQALGQKEAEIRAQKQSLALARRRFTRFIQDNASKKEHAQLRAQDEAQSEEQLRGLQAELQRAYEAAATRLRCLKREVDSLSRYEEFLERVISTSEEFRFADDVLQRHSNLEQTHADLMARVGEGQREAEQARQAAQAAEVREANSVLKINGETARCIQELESTERDSSGLSLSTLKQKVSIEKMMRLVGELILGIDNLYLRCVGVSRLGRRANPSLSLEDKLCVISEVIGDLGAMSAVDLTSRDFRKQYGSVHYEGM